MDVVRSWASWDSNRSGLFLFAIEISICEWNDALEMYDLFSSRLQVSHKLIVNLTLEIQNFYPVMYWIFVINPENMKVFAWLLMHVIRLFINWFRHFSIKSYFTQNCTHDRTYITLYVHEFLLSLHQKCVYKSYTDTTYYNHTNILYIINILNW